MKTCGSCLGQTASSENFLFAAQTWWQARRAALLHRSFPMFRRSFLGLGVAAAMAFTLGSASADPLPDLKGLTIVAVTENAYFPLNFTDPKSGAGIGWEYDAVNEIAKRLDAKVEWKTSSWDAMIQAVQAGQFDIGMDGISITDERKKQIAFSDPYMVSEQFMLVRAD